VLDQDITIIMPGSTETTDADVFVTGMAKRTVD
jgi:hypothetical protein